MRIPISTVTIAGSASLYARVSYEVASGTNGGGSTAGGTWDTRPLNTESDAGGIVSLSANQLTFLAGTYDCLITACLVNAGGGKARLQNVTDATTVALGQNMVTTAAGNEFYSSIAQRFTIGASKALEVQTQTLVAVGTFGIGYPNSFGVSEVYTVAEFWKIS